MGLCDTQQFMKTEQYTHFYKQKKDGESLCIEEIVFSPSQIRQALLGDLARRRSDFSMFAFLYVQEVI